MVPYSENNPTFAGSDTKFSMLFYAATNKDYTWGWDDYNYGPFDVTDNNIGKLIGKTMGRKDFTINFDLYYDGSLTSTTQKMGELTFTFQYTHHNVGTNDQPVDETSSTVNNNVYGGGEQGNVASVGTTVTISGNATVNDVYGAGKGTQGTNVPFTR